MKMFIVKVLLIRKKHLIVDIVIKNLKHKKGQYFMKMFIVKVFLKRMNVIDVVVQDIIQIIAMQKLI